MLLRKTLDIPYLRIPNKQKFGSGNTCRTEVY